MQAGDDGQAADTPDLPAAPGTGPDPTTGPETVPDDRRRHQAEVLRRQIAVALSYAPGTDVAPRVTASGQGALADRLLDLAFANGVKVRRDADLAEMLVAVEVGEIIPLEAFSAVAEIIAYLYRANAGVPDPGVTHPAATVGGDGAVTADESSNETGTVPGDQVPGGIAATTVSGGVHGTAAGYRPVASPGRDGTAPVAGYGPTGAWRGTGTAPAGAGGPEPDIDPPDPPGHRPRTV